MIKWFCDVCEQEIVAPEAPVRIAADRCGKNRSDAEVGWGESDDIINLFCHDHCADVLEGHIKAALNTARMVVRA